MKYTAIIPTYNQLPTLKKLREALSKQTNQDFDILLAVDGSTDGTVDWADEQGIEYVWQEQQGRRYNEICNQAAREAVGEYLILISGDSVPADDNYIERINELVAPNRLISGLRLNVDDHGKIISPDYRLKFFAHKDLPRTIHIKEAEPWKYANSNGMCIPKAMWQQLGGFCEEYKDYGTVDIDLAMRAHYAGYENWWACEALLYHYDLVKRQDHPSNTELFHKRQKEYEKARTN
jgi:GT2 family glycosyltransferase